MAKEYLSTYTDITISGSMNIHVYRIWKYLYPPPVSYNYLASKLRKLFCFSWNSMGGISLYVSICIIIDYLSVDKPFKMYNFVHCQQ